ncbi:MAG: DUF192 domain-containing protein [Alphaproteobacteria bacterium]
MSLILRRMAAAIAVLLALGAATGASAVEQGTLDIVTAEGVMHRFEVEVVRTPQDMAVGLMFRQEMAADAGMLFVYAQPRETSFWMKNTLLPLDMLFIDADGLVHHIAERTVPLSTTPVPSRGPVRAVLEVNGGTCERLGIAPGDRVIWPEFGG